MRTLTMPMFLLALVLGGCAADAPTTPAAPARPAADGSATFPGIIGLPNGFGADGISFGSGSTFYVGSLVTGAIWRGDAATGTGSLLVNPPAGRSACGVAYDQANGRVFAAGTMTGQAYVYDATTGATLAVYQLSDPNAELTLIQGVAVVGNAAYFTDLFQSVLYRIPFGPNGQLPPQSAVQVLPFSSAFQFVPGALNASGIIGTPDQRWLIVVNVTTGALYRVDPATGQTTAINLAGGSLPAGDGLALIGTKLYVVQADFNQVAVVTLSPDFTSGVIAPQTITNAALDSPAKIAAFGNGLYVVNARFEVDPAPDVTYQVVRLSP